MTWERWTEENVITLRKLWRDGLSASQIAREMKVPTRNAVIGKIHRLGLSGRDKTKQADKVNLPKLEPKPVIIIARSERPLSRGLLPMAGKCKWPTGDPKDPANYFTCGRQSLSNGPYCKTHHEIAFRGRS